MKEILETKTELYDKIKSIVEFKACLLYTSDAADDNRLV